MCEKNINQILDLDFSLLSDEFNWINNTGNPLETIDGQLKIIPDGINSVFSRNIGLVDPINNRLKVEMLLDVFRPQNSNNENICVVVDVLIDSNVIDSFSINVSPLNVDSKVQYFFDRIYKFDNLSGTATIKFSFPEGFENQICLSYLKVIDYTYKDCDVRSYFIVDNMLDDFKNSVVSTIDLKEFKVDGIETLTPDFFNDQIIGTDPLNFLFAKSRIDGENRIEENDDPNTFNPFSFLWNLDFENTSSNYFGGKPIATTNGNDYGSGIFQFGFDIPEILNGLLESKKGAFFVDIDFSKDLRIVFDVVVNKTTSSLLRNPEINKRFYITFNVSKCETKFEYRDLKIKDGPLINIDEDGFLSGITDFEINENVILCDESFDYNGNDGMFEFEINFGPTTGIAGINYQAFSLPDKFEIEWNNQLFSSGYVGSSTYDQQLINLGISQSEINTASPSNGNGNLFFNKDQENPQTAKIRVSAPFTNTAWNVVGICPGTGNPNPSSVLEIAKGVCRDRPTIWSDVYVNTPDPSLYSPSNGDVLFTDILLSNVYDGNGESHKMRINVNGAQLGFDVDFDVDQFGVISNLTSCSNGNGNDDVILTQLSDTQCFSCWKIVVEVPSGETRSIDLLSNFAPSGNYSGGNCIGSSNAVYLTSDQTVNINETTEFIVGIEGFNGTTQIPNTSIVTFTVSDDQNVIDQYNLTRFHIDENC